MALGRLRDRAAGGQVGHPRRRTRRPGRSCARTTPELIRQEHAAWTVATELVHAATRSRRRHRRTLPQRPPHRAARRGPAPVVHHRPPHPDHHRAGRRRHRLAARTRPGRRPPARPGRDRHRPGHHRPAPPPRPQDQNQAGVLRTPRAASPPAPPPPTCTSAAPRPDPAPSRPPTRTSPRTGTRRTRPDSRAAAMRPARCHSPYITRRSPQGSAAPRTTSSPWHCAPPRLQGAGNLPSGVRVCARQAVGPHAGRPTSGTAQCLRSYARSC